MTPSSSSWPTSGEAKGRKRSRFRTARCMLIRWSTFAPAVGPSRLDLDHVIDRGRVVDDDGRGRRLGHQLVSGGEGHADAPLGLEQLEQLRLVGQVGARAVAERVALAALRLEAELAADPAVLP